MKTQHDRDLEAATTAWDKHRNKAFVGSKEEWLKRDFGHGFLNGIEYERSRKSEVSVKGFEEWYQYRYGITASLNGLPFPKDDPRLSAWQAAYSSRDGEVEELKKENSELKYDLNFLSVILAQEHLTEANIFMINTILTKYKQKIEGMR